MILPDSDIRKRNIIEPWNEEQLQSGTYDLTLGKTEHHSIKPGEFMLATTVEKVMIPPDLMGIVKGHVCRIRKRPHKDGKGRREWPNLKKKHKTCINGF